MVKFKEVSSRPMQMSAPVGIIAGNKGGNVSDSDLSKSISNTSSSLSMFDPTSDISNEEIPSEIAMKYVTSEIVNENYQGNCCSVM